MIAIDSGSVKFNLLMGRSLCVNRHELEHVLVNNTQVEILFLHCQVFVNTCMPVDLEQ